MNIKVLEGYLLEKDYAADQKKSLRWAQKQRARGEGPPYLKIGRQVYYHIDRIREYLVQQELQQPRAPKPRR